ncbi:MAG: gfo/Idh/MocA family oxidoreductase [Verrucomicrobia bacterium]|nr:MAG: gfo/Idh/MocA family oxidoreductase [Verrucomicrobiota bacterium]
MTTKKAVSSDLNRRRFLARTGLSLAGWQLVSSGVLAASPNERLNIAGIGVGSRGGADVNSMASEGQNIVALCDVDSKYAGKMFDKYPKARRFTDYRKMLDAMDKEIDAVVIGTPDHTHAVIAMEAMRRGKHVYCEKPLAHSVHEVRTLMQMARESKVVTQLGNQGHSFGDIRRLCEWVWDGAIGEVREVWAGCDAFRNVYCQIPNLPKLKERHPVPPNLDYDLWIGPVPYIPYSPLWVHWNWRGWMPFGTGCIGDWFCHVLDPAFWALDLDAPVSVRAEVTGYDPAKHAMCYPPATRITFEFPAKGKRGPVKVVWHDGANRIPRPEGLEADEKLPGTGGVLIGDKGMIIHGSHGAGGCRIAPEKRQDEYLAGGRPEQKIPRVKNHAWDFIQAIKEGRQAGSHFGYGGPLTQAALLGAIAIRFPGETLRWDDAKATFTNHGPANAYLHVPYREGWRL